MSHPDQNDWPDLVLDLTFQENRKSGGMWVVIQDLDVEADTVDVGYFANVRTWGPGGGWDSEEVDSERLTFNEVYRRLNNDSWEVLSYPLSHPEWK